jgi:hypothetical protein
MRASLRPKRLPSGNLFAWSLNAVSPLLHDEVAAVRMDRLSPIPLAA